MTSPDFGGKRVTVVGLGIEGTALARYLVGRGAQVTVSDAKPAEALSASLARVQDLPLRLCLGGNREEDCTSADAVFVSQGVPLNIPALRAARARGVPIGSVTRLFMDLCPAPIAAVTGSAGKSTTTALTGEIFRAAGRRTWVGGNIGVMLLERVEEIAPEDWVVLEISHTQLELTSKSPQIACITNLAPSHADRYSWEEYVALKKRIFEFQSGDDVLVLNLDDPTCRALAADVRGRLAFFSRRQGVPADGAHLQSGMVMVRWDGAEQAVLPSAELRLRGMHNLENVLAACAVAAAAGLPAEAMARAAREFTGVEHRLEPVRTLGGVVYYNDSIATAPNRVIAGLRSFDRPIVLLAGGRDKHLPLDEWAREVSARCTAVVFFGEAGPLFEEALAPRWRGREPLVRVWSLRDAVPLAQSLARPGEVVLLSPGGTSFDQYPNFEARGREFKDLVRALPEEQQVDAATPPAGRRLNVTP